MQTLDNLQRLTPSQGALLYRLVDLGYLMRAQVDELVNRLVSDRFAKAKGGGSTMTEYYLPLGSEVMEIDYEMLREVVRRALVEAWGEGVVQQVEVAHFNPRMIDVTVYVSERRTSAVSQN